MGILEILIILAVVALLFGPKLLPKLGDFMGKAVGSFRAGLKEGGREKGQGSKPPHEDEGEGGAGEERS